MTIASTPAAFLHAVADPQRWELLSWLGTSDRRVGELVDLTGKAQNLVSYHLGELRSAGLVSTRRSSADGRDTYYRLEAARFRELLAAAGASLHPGLRLAPVTSVVSVAAAQPPSGRRRRPRVLFLCTGNSARSQIAEALLEHRSGHTIEARSAGTHPKALHPHAVRVLAERGIDISDRTTKSVDRFVRHRFDRVVTLCDKAREVCPELPNAAAAAHWSMADPAATTDGDGDETGAAFERIADEIEVRIGLLIAELTELTDRNERSPSHANR